MAARKLKTTQKINLSDKRPGSIRTVEYMSNLKYMGDEPQFSPLVEITDTQYSKALLWYNTMCSRDSAKKYTEAYLKKQGRLIDCGKLKQVPDVWFPSHIGWIARLATRGTKLKQRTLDAFESRLQEAFSKIPVETKIDRVEKKPVNIQERIADKASELMYELEKYIDDNGYQSTFSVYDWLTKRQASVSSIPHMIKFFQPIANEYFELNDAVFNKPKNACKQLLEGYDHLSKTEVKHRFAFYTKLMSDLDKYSGNIRKQRAPRKKKTITPDKKLKSFKFQKECTELRLASINPEKIFTSDEIWTINTKYKVLTVLRRGDDAFDVSGTSFKNYDESKSKSYRLGRKFESIVEDLTKPGKRAIGKLVERLKETALQTRSGEHTILLKVL